MFKSNKHQLTTIAFGLLLLLPLGYKFYRDFGARLLGHRVEAVGDLVITYLGVPLGDPVFSVTNLLPGDCHTRTIDVDNSGLTPAAIAVKSRNEIDTGQLSPQLTLVISDSGSDLYGGANGEKTVSDFFTDSLSGDGVPLGSLSSGSQTSYHLQVCLRPETGNLFANLSTTFDLAFGEITSSGDPLP